MQQTADVVVIGGGAIGCSTAYYLAKHGVRNVVIVEMAQVGAGSSSRSAAMLSLQFCRDKLSLQMAKYAYDQYMGFEEEIGVSTDFRKIGWLYLATAESAAALGRQAALLQAQEVATEVLTPAEVKRRYPLLNTEDIVLGTWGPDDGSFDPHMIMHGYVKRAKGLGVELVEGAQALDVLVGRERVTGVVTNRGLISTPIVVNAAGPWAARVGRWAGAEVPLLNSARSIVVTNPIAAIPSDYPFVEDLSTEWYFRPELDSVLMGMGDRPVDDPEGRLDEEQVMAIVETAVHRIPALSQASLRTAWTGVRPLTPDGRAIVGSPAGLEGFIFNCGWGGVGIIMAPIAGQLVAEIVVEGEMKSVAGRELSPARFSAAPGRGR